MIVALKLSRAPSYGLFAALLLLLLLLFSRTEDRHRHSSASVAGEPTSPSGRCDSDREKPGLRARPLSCACGKGGGHGAQCMSLAESIESRSTLSRRTSYCMGMGADCVYVSCNLGARMVSARYELK